MTKDDSKVLDINFVRSQFATFDDPELGQWAYMENAGGSLAPRQVTDIMGRYFGLTKVQPYADYPASKEVGDLMDAAHEKMAAHLGLTTDWLHFGPSTSMNSYVIAQAIKTQLGAGDEVIVTHQDHEANIGAWARLGEGNSGVRVRVWEPDPVTGLLDLASLDALLSSRTKWVAMTHCSNIAGTINPVKEAAEKVHAAGGRLIVDGVSFAPHGLPDIKGIGADIYLYSTYKTYGPHQGIILADPDLVRELPNQGHYFNEGRINSRLTPAGPMHGEIAGCGGIVDYYQAVYDHHFDETAESTAEMACKVFELFHAHEQVVGGALLDALIANPKVRLFGKQTMEGRAPTFAFTVEGERSEDVVARLREAKIGAGWGDFYATRLVEHLGVNADAGVVRLSLVHYNSVGEVGRFKL